MNGITVRRPSGLRCDHSRVENPGVTASHGTPVPELSFEFPELLARAQGGSPQACQWLYESLAGRVAGQNFLGQFFIGPQLLNQHAE